MDSIDWSASKSMSANEDNFRNQDIRKTRWWAAGLCRPDLHRYLNRSVLIMEFYRWFVQNRSFAYVG